MTVAERYLELHLQSNSDSLQHSFIVNTVSLADYSLHIRFTSTKWRVFLSPLPWFQLIL